MCQDNARVVSIQKGHTCQCQWQLMEISPLPHTKRRGKGYEKE